MKHKQQTANSKQQTANSKQQTANSKQQTANSKQQTALYILKFYFLKSLYTRCKKCFNQYKYSHCILGVVYEK
ncbi:hypothetical protein [uncultured Brachyspira sp.]|uniref:hypothetical protein n=1 Tax=uncultured Brachyspira sp. TaxID=221953 RepID=UPI002627C78D|nr:hypothetical protein [uncultured Brachyspira sp.]